MNLKEDKECQYDRIKTTFRVHPHPAHNQKYGGFHQYPRQLVGNGDSPGGSAKYPVTGFHKVEGDENNQSDQTHDAQK